MIIMKQEKNTTEARACTQQTRVVTAQDLPLCCPLPAYRLWDAHPRVYMPIEETGREVCPYCGTIYIYTHST